GPATAAGTAADAPATARPVLPAPAIVGPTAPDEQLQPVLKDVVLAWRPVAGAAGYRVQVSQDGDFSDAVTVDSGSVAARLALPGWLPNAAYRWRVAAKQASGGHGYWSFPGAFTKGWRDRPTLLGPFGDVAADRPVFSWNPVPGASEYEVQVSTSQAFDQDPVRQQAPVSTTTCFTTRTSVSPQTTQSSARNGGAGPCLSLTAYGEDRYWRVRALDHVVGADAEVDTTPVDDGGVSYLPPEPEPGALDLTTCPQSPGTSTAPSPSPSASSSAPASPSPSPTATASPSPTATASPSPTASPSGSPASRPAPDGCTPANTVVRGSWSMVGHFRVLGAPLGELTPATYEPVAVTPSADLCTRRPDRPGEGPQYDCAEFPSLSWTKRDGAYRYRVYVALDDAFTNVQEVVEISALTWTPTTAWRDTTAVQSYYVAVQACTAVRCGAVSGSPTSLRKKSPRSVLTAPADGALVGAEDVQLRWQPFSVTQAAALASRTPGARATAEAYAYRVQVARAPQDGRSATDADFQDLVEDVVVDGSACRPGALPAGVLDPRRTVAVQSCDAAGVVVADPVRDEMSYVSPAAHYPSGDYVWRVQALDASGHRLSWSAPRTFRRDLTAPTATITGPATAAADAAFVVRFSEPVTGAGARTVALVPTGATSVAASVAVAADRRSVVLRPVRTWTPGARYRVEVRPGIADAAGNAVQPTAVAVRIAPLVDDRSPALRYTGRWTPRAASDAVGRGFRTTNPVMRAQTKADVVLHGAGVLLTGCVGPLGGFADVYVDGVKVKRVDTYRSYSGCGVRLARVPLAPGDHRVQVRAVGLKRPQSRGRSVGLDALTAL
ncbi:MAG: Ig-like domain-containing protein, partial [Actinomycetota bacterium]|nr:Ig-like domain-containing protein [Actinomycetota bacterium]